MRLRSADTLALSPRSPAARTSKHSRLQPSQADVIDHWMVLTAANSGSGKSASSHVASRFLGLTAGERTAANPLEQPVIEHQFSMMGRTEPFGSLMGVHP